MKKILFIILMFPFLCHADDFTIGGKRVVVFGESFNIGSITAANPAVVTCSGGSELVTNGDCESALPTMNGVSLSSAFSVTPSQSADTAYSGTKSMKLTCFATSTVAGVYFLNSVLCGVDNGYWQHVSTWVYIPSGQGITSVKLSIRDSVFNYYDLDSTSTTDTWVELTGNFLANNHDRIVYIRFYAANTNGLYIYTDDLSVKPIHNLIAGERVILQTSETSINNNVYRVSSINSGTGDIMLGADFHGLVSPVSGGKIANAAAWNKKIVNF